MPNKRASPHLSPLQPPLKRHHLPSPQPHSPLAGDPTMPVDALPGSGQTVCVTGAGGFIASWMVKLLLERGYAVRGTVRNPDDPKNAHLRELEGARERLTLHKGDLLDYESLREAIKGCDGVFHTASPVTDDPMAETCSSNPFQFGDYGDYVLESIPKSV